MASARLALTAVALIPVLAVAAPHPATTHGFPNAKLIAAAKSAPLKLIDALEVYCDADTPIEAWLTRLSKTQSTRIRWTAGRCELVNDLNPLDAGGDYCVQATLTLRHPKNRKDSPEIEIYLEQPKGGKAGEVYAFRASFDSVDGPDYIRFRRDFEAEWRERFKDAPAPACTDE